MSRLGKLVIIIPSGVQVEKQPNGVVVKGPKGELIETLPREVMLTQEGNQITVTVPHPGQRHERALWGLARQLVANAVKGVHEGFVKKLEISGIGYKAQVEGKDLVLNLGFSHPVRYAVPSTITITVEKNVISVAGASKQLVGQTAAEIRGLKPPEPYKGKGIRYAGELVRRKAGKVVKSVGTK
ncbi:MAG: 50S ribosomal protein L6 [Candidatus Veblenbacteria bacterium]|nr:50S ribosomal protein L6 [Candidatus Veblenbacteria bacterium]